MTDEYHSLILLPKFVGLLEIAILLQHSPDAVNNKTLFMNWFQETVVKSVPDTCSDSLFIYVGSTADLTERNQYSG
jgi:hypothetical protein